MESLMNQPVHFSGGNAGGPGYGYGAGYGSDLLGPLLLGSALGRGGLFGGGYGPTVAAVQGPALVELSALLNEKSSSDTRRDVKESESEVRESIHHQTVAFNDEFRGLDCKLNSISRDSLASRYEAIISGKDSTFALTNKIDCETNSLRTQNFVMQTSMDKQFSDLNHRIEKGLHAIERRDMQREIDELRREGQENRNAVVIDLLKQILAGQA